MFRVLKSHEIPVLIVQVWPVFPKATVNTGIQCRIGLAQHTAFSISTMRTLPVTVTAQAAFLAQDPALGQYLTNGGYLGNT